jgi:hypothetical protein
MKSIINIHIYSIQQISRVIIIILIPVLLLHANSLAQVAVIGAGGTTSASGSNAGPIFRSSASSTFDFSNHYYLYTSSELAAAGIALGSTITAIAWNKGNALGTAATNTSSVFQVHMKNSSGSPGASWCSSSYATQSSGATLVYNNPAQLIPLSSGYITLTLSTPFVYSGGSLEIGTNWNCSAHIGNPTTGGFTWKQDALSNQVFGGSNSSASISMSPQSSRPQIQITHTLPSPCIGTPSPGNTISSVGSACVGVSFSLSLQNVITGTGVTYQWQQGDNFTFTDIINATSPTLSQTQTTPTYYRCLVTCNGNTGISTPVLVGMHTFINCYCIPITTNGCGSSDHITNVNFNTINNTTGACISGGSYSDYTSISTNIVGGNAYNISMSTANGGIEYGAVWIDFDHSGIFDASEFTNIPLTLSGGVWNGSTMLTVSGSAVTGVTGMRVRSSYSAPITAGSACGTYIAGETEDYRVNILACTTADSTTITACDSYTWACNGTTYTTSGTYICTSINMNGCTGTHTLQLTINNSNSTTTTASTSSPFFWTCSGSTYTASGTYTFTSLNANGCTNNSTLNLTITTLGNTTTVCGFFCQCFTWPCNGVIYINSGIYTCIDPTDGLTKTLVLVYGSGPYNSPNIPLFSADKPLVQVPPLIGWLGCDPKSYTVTVCPGDCITFTATGLTYYRWYNESNPSVTLSTGPSLTVCPSFQSAYIVETSPYPIPSTGATDCYDIGRVDVFVSSPLSVAVTPFPPTCCEDPGGITIMPNGGSGPYTIELTEITTSWTHIENSTFGFSLSNVPTGTYNITVTDVNGCTTITTSTLSCGPTAPCTHNIFNVTLNGDETFPLYSNVNACDNQAPEPGSLLKTYSNFKTLGNLTTMAAGCMYPFSIKLDYCGAPLSTTFYTAIWIDYNQDGDFLDIGEEVATQYISYTGSPPFIFNGYIIIPFTAASGTTTMRVVTTGPITGSPLFPCEQYACGETEDYQINICH